MWSEALWNAPAGVAGLALLLFVPGYYLGRLSLPESRAEERVVISVVLSLAVNISLGLGLAWLGAFRPGVVWMASAGVSAAFFALHLLVHREPF